MCTTVVVCTNFKRLITYKLFVHIFTKKFKTPSYVPTITGGYNNSFLSTNDYSDLIQQNRKSKIYYVCGFN